MASQASLARYAPARWAAAAFCDVARAACASLRRIGRWASGGGRAKVPAAGAVVRRPSGPRRAAALALAVTGLLAGCAQAPAADSAPRRLDVDALTRAMARAPIVLLGEVHDNAAQHALRAQALQRLLAGGARPAIAFEQFDSEQQAAIDAIRAEPGLDAAARAERLIAAAGAKGWDWALYRPYVQLALQYDLPIVAANLSRSQAMRVATEGLDAVFTPAQRGALGLDHIGPELERAQEYEIELGHCGGLPADALPAMAQAQIARDAMLAQALLPYLGRGVVLLTGNGHARRDIGVPQHLSAADQARLVSIGLLEDDGKADTRAGFFDVSFLTPVQKREDPCLGFEHHKRRTPPAGAPAMGTR